MAGGKECARCHEILEERKPTPALGHDFKDGELQCVHAGCKTVVGEEAEQALRFANAKTIRPASLAELPKSISGDAVILDISGLPESLDRTITIFAQDLRIVGSPSKSFRNLTLQVDDSLIGCCISLVDVHIINDNNDNEEPILKSTTGNSVYLCSCSAENSLSTDSGSVVSFPNGTLKLCGHANFSLETGKVIVSEGVSSPTVSANAVEILICTGTSLTIKGGLGANGGDGTSHNRDEYDKDNAVWGGNGGRGEDGGDGLRAESVTIHVSGNISITGGNAGNGGYGGNGKGSNLPGNGKAGGGGSGGDGGNGGNAIWCANCTFDYPDPLYSSVTLTGGNGGAGGSGGAGGNAYAGNNRDDAGDGGYGGNGGRAGYCIGISKAGSNPVLSKDITLKGGSGGTGGSGGAGGNGAHFGTDRSENGSGGRGGNGGNSYLTKNCPGCDNGATGVGTAGSGNSGGGVGSGGNKDTGSPGGWGDNGSAGENEPA